MNRPIVTIFRKNYNKFEDPIQSLFGSKKITYTRLINKLYQEGAQPALTLGIELVENNIYFKSGEFWNYDKQRFEEHESYTAYSVYDQSGGFELYPIESETAKHVVNVPAFKRLAASKIETYEFLKELSPESWIVRSTKELLTISNHFNDNELIVIKPDLGMQGKDIIISHKRNIPALNFEERKALIVQKFLDSSIGIPGLVQGVHDVRFIVINNKVVFVHIRQPRKGELLANVKQGGSLMEAIYDEFPDDIKDLVESVKAKIAKNFYDPVYSIDVANTKQGPKVIELNSRMGLPRPESKNRDYFITEFVKRLLKPAS